jgi:hypothetical protein
MRRPSSPTPAPFRCHDCGGRAREVTAVKLKVPRLLARNGLLAQNGLLTGCEFSPHLSYRRGTGRVKNIGFATVELALSLPCFGQTDP